MYYKQIYQSPIGIITIIANDSSLVNLYINKPKYPLEFSEEIIDNVQLPILINTKKWLDNYFNGLKPMIPLSIYVEGTRFQKDVWTVLQDIPYGSTLTYKEIATKIAQKYQINKMSAQAVGVACSHNPLPLIIPCHRVIGKKSLVGYAYGLEIKNYLLELEKK